MPLASVRVAVFVCLGILGFVACSASSSTIGPTCGQGTTLVADQCVAIVDRDATIVEDATAEDGPGREPSSDGSSDGTNPIVGDALMGDSSEATDGSPVADADAAALRTSDPCPGSSLPPLWADCSDQCSVEGGFDASTCGTSSGDYDLVCPGPYTSVGTIYTLLPTGGDLTLRTPDHAVSACVAQCTSDGGPRVTAALVFGAHAGNYDIEVGAPWKISTPTSVATAGFMSSCSGPDASLVTGPVCSSASGVLFVVWTDDPNPPARNIVIRRGVTCP